MRSVRVFFLLSCIRISIGFVVPKGIKEVVHGSSAPIYFSERKKTNGHNDTTSIAMPKYVKPQNELRDSGNKEEDLENHQTAIKDNEIYELTNNSTQSNISERSFVYINQKFRTPLLGQLHTSNSYLKNMLQFLIYGDTEFTKYKDSSSAAFFDYRPEYSVPGNGHNELSNSPMLSKLIENNQPAHSNGENFHDPKILGTVLKNRGNLESQKEYILKPPFVKSKIATEMMSEKTDQAVYNKNENLSTYKQSHNSEVKMHTPRTFHLTKRPAHPHLDIPTPFDNINGPVPNDNHMVSSPFEHGKGLFAELRAENPMKPTVNNKYIGLLEDKMKSVKVLDTYEKESIEDQVANESLNAMYCNTKECLSKKKKKFFKNYNSKKECSCGENIKSKILNSNKDTTKKDFFQNNDLFATSKFPEINDYIDMMGDDRQFATLM